VLAEAASTQSQLAYAALTKSLQHKWNFLLHVISKCGPFFRILICHSSLASYWPFLVQRRLLLSDVYLRFLCDNLV